MCGVTASTAAEHSCACGCVDCVPPVGTRLAGGTTIPRLKSCCKFWPTACACSSTNGKPLFAVSSPDRSQQTPPCTVPNRIMVDLGEKPRTLQYSRSSTTLEQQRRQPGRTSKRRACRSANSQLPFCNLQWKRLSAPRQPPKSRIYRADDGSSARPKRPWPRCPPHRSVGSRDRYSGRSAARGPGQAGTRWSRADR